VSPANAAPSRPPRAGFRGLARRTLYWLLPVAVYLGCALHLPRNQGRDLVPTPDAVEYAMLSQRLARLQPPLIDTGLQLYPSRYPLAFPLALAPFNWLAGFDLTRLHWAATCYGLLSVLLMARVGAWLLGSRTAGGLAALFWALHPALLEASAVVMSETAIVAAWLALLQVGRPWLEPGGPAPGLARGIAAGLLAGWLTVAKAPFAYWALVFAILVWDRALARRRFAAAIGLTLAGLLCAFGDALYRHWAFGDWRLNGYQFWHPVIYSEFRRTFNPRYALEGYVGYGGGIGNLVYYARHFLGLTGAYYGRYAAPVAAAALACLLWPRRRGRPWGRVVLILAGWAAVGALFLGTYFFLEYRLGLLWLPLIDGLAAWGLMRAWTWSRLRRGPFLRWRAHRWAQVLAIFAAAILIRSAARHAYPVMHPPPGQVRASQVDSARRLLAHVPADAWLFSGWEAGVVNRIRPRPGPTAGLYSWIVDAPVMNGHLAKALEFDLRPVGITPLGPAGREELPAAWRREPAVLLIAAGAGDAAHWTISPAERERLFHRPAYILAQAPPWFPSTAEFLNKVVLPTLARELHLEEVARHGDFVLYRARAE